MVGERRREAAREEFLAEIGDAKARLAAGSLGPVGLLEEEERISREYCAKLEGYRRAEEQARKRAQQLRTELTAPKKIKSADADEAVEKAFQPHPAITRYESLPPDKRPEALRIALEKRAHGFLSILLSEPALVMKNPRAGLKSN